MKSGFRFNVFILGAAKEVLDEIIKTIIIIW